MNKRDFESIERGIRFSQAGSLYWQESLTFPFIKDVSSQLTASGFGEELTDFHLPSDVFPPQKRTHPRAALGAVELLVGVSIFLGTSIAGWVVKKICDEVFDKKIRPALRKLKARFEKKEKGEAPAMKVQFGVWYDVDQIYVQAIAEISAPEDFDHAERLILQAHKAALAWVDSHGVTHRVLTYRISHNEVSAHPILSDSCLTSDR